MVEVLKLFVEDSGGDEFLSPLTNSWTSKVVIFTNKHGDWDLFDVTQHDIWWDFAAI
jgi:hypothetical protein